MATDGRRDKAGDGAAQVRLEWLLIGVDQENGPRKWYEFQ